MARRTRDVPINEVGRDKGKMYLITEMSAFDTEIWCKRVINAIVRNADKDELLLVLPLFYSYINNLNEKTPTQEEMVDLLKSEAQENKINIDQASEALGINFCLMYMQLPPEELEGLSLTLLKCCKHYTSYEAKVTDDVLNNPLYCEEASTLMILQKEAFGLHTDFFVNAVKQHLPSLTAKVIGK